MSECWIDVPDEAGSQRQRSFIDRNAIALRSNGFSPIDTPNEKWLGRFSPRREIRESGLWNLNYVAQAYDPSFLDKFEFFVKRTCQEYPRPKAKSLATSHWDLVTNDL